ncbi:POK6 protein, partial [Panurus biarmicus]|nr:POK6 protein [Panurus biarmicus]
EGSPQIPELTAVVRAFQLLQEPLNFIADSAYVANIVKRIEGSFLKEVNNKDLYHYLVCMQKKAVKMREHPFAIIHIRSHKWDIGLGEGNARADKLVSISQKGPVPMHVLAREAHTRCHQNAQGLHREFQISIEEARTIVRTCPVCSHHNGGSGLEVGVNPRGLQANATWQMDVTHVSAFGRLRYVHVTIDAFSHYIWATAQSGERAKNVERHLSSCFAVMGVPQVIKIDNGPAYASQCIAQFMQMWGVKHVTGIPNSPTGQAIVERANRTLKQYLAKYSNI